MMRDQESWKLNGFDKVAAEYHGLPVLDHQSLLSYKKAIDITSFGEDIQFCSILYCSSMPSIAFVSSSR